VRDNATAGKGELDSPWTADSGIRCFLSESQRARDCDHSKRNLASNKRKPGNVENGVKLWREKTWKKEFGEFPTWQNSPIFIATYLSSQQWCYIMFEQVSFFHPPPPSRLLPLPPPFLHLQLLFHLPSSTSNSSLRMEDVEEITTFGFPVSRQVGAVDRISDVGITKFCPER